MGAVRVQAADFDAAAEGRALTAGRREIGALRAAWARSMATRITCGLSKA